MGTITRVCQEAVSLSSIRKSVFYQNGLICKEDRPVVMSIYICMELCKLTKNKNYYYIPFIAQMAFQLLSPLEAAPISCHQVTISFSEEFLLNLLFKTVCYVIHVWQY